MPGSLPKSRMRPRHPSSRSVTAALPPASPAPTITATCSPVASACIVNLSFGRAVSLSNASRSAPGVRRPAPCATRYHRDTAQLPRAERLLLDTALGQVSPFLYHALYTLDSGRCARRRAVCAMQDVPSASEEG